MAAFGFFFALVGFGLLVMSLRNVVRGLQSLGWPASDGVIESSNTKAQEDSEGGTSWSIDIVYRYRVAEIEYVGKRLAFGYLASPKSALNSLLQKYPAGRRVTIQYSPSNPKLAVLEAGISPSVWGILAFAAAFLSVGLFFAIGHLAATGDGD